MAQDIEADRTKLICGLQLAIDDPKLQSYREQTLQVFTAIESDSQNHYLSLASNDPNKISYARLIEDKFNTKKRIKTTLSRYIRRQLELDHNVITDFVLSTLSEIVRYHVQGKEYLNNQVRVISGSDITDYYANEGSKHSNSCMTGSAGSAFIKIFEMNPEQVALAVSEKHGRGLIWTCDDGTVILDRVYPSGSEQVGLIRNWAESNNYVLRANPDCLEGSDNDILLKNGGSYEVTLKHNKVFPYMDTLCFGYLSEDKIVVSNAINSNTNAILQDQHGGYVSINICTQCKHRDTSQNSARESTTVNGKFYCNSCFRDRYYHCSKCDSFGLKSDSSSFVIGSDVLCKDCYNETILCPICDNRVFRTHKISDELTICTDCFTKHFFRCSCCFKLKHCDDLQFDSELKLYTCLTCEMPTVCFRCGNTLDKSSSQIRGGKGFCSYECTYNHQDFESEGNSQYKCMSCEQIFLTEFHPYKYNNANQRLCPYCAEEKTI